MPRQVRVYNDGRFEHKERFRGEIVTIPPGGFIEMDRDDAIEFKSTFRPVLTDGEGNQMEEGQKRIRVEGAYDAPKDDVPLDLIDHATGKVAKNRQELDQLVRENAHMLAEEKVRDAVLERDKLLEAQAAKDAKIKELQEQLAAAKASQGKPSGRPKKDNGNGQT